MERSLDFHKDLMIRQHLKDMRATRPDLSFQQTWALVRKAHPDLFETESGWHSERDALCEIRQPHEQPPSNQRSAVSAVGNPAELDLTEICQRMRIPVRVEASSVGGKRYLELAECDAALLEDYLEASGYRLERIPAAEGHHLLEFI